MLTIDCYEDINDLAAAVHEKNHRWWHDPVTGAKLKRNRDEMLMLIVSEISEAMEGERKDLKDDKLPHRPMAEVELADVMIRVLDFAAGIGLTIDYPDQKMSHLSALENTGNKAEMLFILVRRVYAVWLSMELVQHPESTGLRIGWLLQGIADYCKHFGYDLNGAFDEKMTFNLTRKDHTLEARMAPGGKKW